MECFLAHLIACFSWSSVYVSGDISVLDTTLPRIERQWSDASFSEYRWGSNWTDVLTDRSANPYGGLAVGYQLQFSNIDLAFEASHLSSIADNDDRGVNALTIRARWYPFRRGR